MGINFDPVLRAIDCRVPFTNWSLDALIMGTKIPRGRFEQGMKQLEDLGFISVSRTHGITLLKPSNYESRVQMRRWAYSGALATSDAR